MPEQSEPLSTWAIVEILGHTQYAGWMTEHVIGSAALIRVDVPETDQNGFFTKPFTKMIGAALIYCITPCTEAVARAAARRLERFNNPIPVDISVPPQLTAGSAASVEDAEFENEDDKDDEDERPF
jgi:hypothetical protein